MWFAPRTISIRSCRVDRWFASTRCVKRSLSSTPFEAIHKPVLLQEAIDYLSPKPGNTYCDLTFGDGGYTRALLDNCDCKVVAVDQDPIAYEKALQLAQLSEYRGRLFPLLGRFGEIDRLVRQGLQWDLPCFDGLVMDIGVSSGQLETASRGFSYQLDGPLDMRMFSRGKQSNETKFEEEERLLHKSVSAYEVVNYYNQNHLADIIYKYGGDRLSRKIASAIVSARHKRPIETTTELAAIVNKACPQPRWQRGDDDMVRNSAARTFQAVRIHVNDELGELEAALRSSEYLLRPTGRLVVVTFHSLEDRLVKTFLNHCAGRRNIQDAQKFGSAKEAYRQAMRGKVELKPPIKEWGEASFTLCTKRVVKASQEERLANMRSRSAKLRAAERTEAPPLAPFGSL